MTTVNHTTSVCLQSRPKASISEKKNVITMTSLGLLKFRLLLELKPMHE